MSITSANSTIFLTVPDVFGAPQQLQGYDVDDSFMAQSVKPAETKIGVDGKKAAGFVPVLTPVEFAFMADSPSIAVFEAWYAAQAAARETFDCDLIINIPGTGTTYAGTKGTLTNYSPLPKGGKTLGPRKFEVTFEELVPAPLG